MRHALLANVVLDAPPFVSALPAHGSDGKRNINMTFRSDSHAATEGVAPGETRRQHHRLTVHAHRARTRACAACTAPEEGQRDLG